MDVARYPALWLCQNHDMNFVTFETKSESAFFAKLANGKPTYVGIDDQVQEGVFRNYDGTTPVVNSLISWISGEPNNDGNEDCVAAERGGFNDNPCSRLMRAGCMSKLFYDDF